MAEISLHYGHTSAIISTRGAQIVSFRGADGREALWKGDPAVWSKHAPILFPICGSLRNGRVRIAGQEYSMPKHGFAIDAEYQTSHIGDDFVDLALVSTAESRAMYPFDFVFHVTYRLFENGFTTTFLVENNSDRVMPFCLGGHPGFACPMEDGAAFEDYQLVFPQIETGEITRAPGGGLIDGTERLDALQNGRVVPLSHDLFDQKDTLIFAGLNSRSVDLTHRVSGHGVRLDFPKMEVLAVWTMPRNHGDYLCLEPWQGMPGRVQDSDNFEDKPYVTLLPPGRVYTTWFTATLI